MNQKACLLFLICLAFSQANSQVQKKYSILNWRVKDGLSQGSVHKMLRDSLGFLWIATDNGLNRFDGTTFKQYIHEPVPLPGAFRGSEVLGIVEDSLHNIWTGTEEGLNRYVTKSDSFQYFATPRSNTNMASYCMPLAALENQVICWEITGKIVSYDIRTGKRKIIFADIPWPVSSYYTLNNLVFDKKTKTIWAPHGNKMICLKLNEKRYEYISLPTANGTCQAIISDGSTLLLATSFGIIRYSASNKIFENVSWAKPLLTSKILSLSQKKDGSILAGVEKKGLFIYEAKSEQLHVYKHISSGFNSISANNINNLYTDKDNITWAASGEKSIDQIFPYEKGIEVFNQQTETYQNPHSVKCFEEDESGNILIGTQGSGIQVFSPGDNTFKKMKINEGFSDTIHLLRFNKSKSSLWIATNTGLYKRESKSRKIIPIEFINLKGHKITQPVIMRHIVSFDDSSMMVATSRGVFILPEKSKSAICVPEMTDHVFFIGSFKNSFSFSLWDFDPVLYSYENRKWTKEQFPFDDITVGCIYFDKKRKVFWIGTDRGLIMTDTHFKRLRQVTSNNGLPDNFIWTITIDNFDHIWLTTNKGIARYIPEKEQVDSYNMLDGIHGLEYNPYANFIASDNTLYFGGKEGFDHINPAILREKHGNPEVYFSSARINNKVIIPSSSANFLEDIKLKSADNNFTISVGIIDFNRPGRNKIRYRLLPAEKDWQEAKVPFDIRYSALSPGVYKLEVSASEMGNKAGNKIRQIKIQILPPFWQSWWSITTATLLLIFIVVFLAQQRINQIRRKEKEKTENIKHMAELELQSLRAQLNPHFMFNSLNAIQELILLEENEKSRSYLAKFSKLLRVLLENADKPFITLQKEIDFLQLYFSLENLRLPDIQFKLIIAPSMDTDNIMIPNMILQPFIENAIWHGLSQKKDNKLLFLRINQDRNNIRFEIEDNGVGRKSAEVMRSLYRKEHKSKGMELLAKRFKLLSREFGSAFELSVSDIMNGDVVCGTMVTINIPANLANDFKSLSDDTNNTN